ncbi:MAG: carbon starvation protein A [Spirochaetales bacterium]|nr:carbon starvation protein A [Spirochaetales bacterium]
MDAVLIMVIAFAGYLIAYKLYGKFIGQKIFKLSDDNKTPAVELEDGKDYVPTKKGIIFGHHFTSIAGTGPIVGPAIGIIWGWLPALIWVLVGTVVMGAVHDFGALVISLRNKGKSISEYTARYANPRMRTLFFLIVLFELWIVLAIFGLIIAIVFSMYPQSVFPVWCEIPIAILLGYIIYKKGGNVLLFSILAVATMYITVILGYFLPFTMPAILGIPAVGVWSIILFIYCFIASTLAVTTLLQPRDYINSHQLYIAMALIVVGALVAAFTGKLKIVAPVVQANPAGAPSMWPFLFITIACGAISGFHSLVASGTSSKQVTKEGDALFVGFGSMMLEGVLATLAIVAVAAGIGMAYQAKDGSILSGTAAWTAHYQSWAGANGLGAKVGAFVEGAANMVATIGIPKSIGIIIMGVFVASFAGTTLDTATRIQRYVVQELAADIKIKVFENKYVATAFAVLTAALLAFSAGASGSGAMTLWPLFGAVNQALAGLALITITLYLKTKGGLKYLITGIPCVFMVVMTSWALIMNEISFVSQGNYLLLISNAIIMAIVAWLIVEGVSSFFIKPKPLVETA